MVEAVVQPVNNHTRSLGISRSDILVGVLLTLVMIGGGYFRFIGQNWDEFTIWHPDERFFTTMTAQLNGPLSFTDDSIDPIAIQSSTCLERYPETGGVGGYFDAQCSAMNPNNVGQGLMAYGTLPAFLTRWSSDAMAQLTNNPSIASYYGARSVGRMISATAEMLVILGTFFIGLRLHGKWVGLLAALLYSCTVFSIQQSHFYTADAVANLMVVMAILGAVWIQTDGRLSSYLFCGLFCGLALASRVNTAPVIGLLLLAAGIQAFPIFDGRLSWNERGRILTNAVIGVAVALLLAFLLFRVFNPYAFTGPGFFGLMPNFRWLQDVGEAQHLVSGNAESPPNWQWVGRTPYVFAFSNMVLWGMGIGLGMAGWLAWLWSGWRILRGKSGAILNIIPFVWILVYFGYLGRVWVMTMRYYLPLYAVIAVLAAWVLVQLVQAANRTNVAWRKLGSRALLIGVAGFTVLWAVMFTNIYRSMFAPAQSTNWVAENLPSDFTMQLEGVSAPLINIAVYNRPGGDDTPVEQQASRYDEGQLFTQGFVAPADGVITKVSSLHLGDPNNSPTMKTITVRIALPGVDSVLVEGTLTGVFSRDNNAIGDAYDIPLSEPLTVKAGESYTFSVAVEGGSLISSGPVMAWEGQWDEVSLPKICAMPPGFSMGDTMPPSNLDVGDCVARDVWGGQLIPQQLQIYWEDEVYKRDVMQRGLDSADYLVISTNRRYDSQSRIPYRWPMTMRFYAALFDGSLGFEQVKTFQETFEFGPLKVSDQYLPTYDGPEWLNEFEAEEAFHVYDHPVVFIFKKTVNYSQANTETILNSVPLTKVEAVQTRLNCPQLSTGSPVDYYCDSQLVGVVNLYSVPASKIPTALQLPPDMAQTQYTNGTWSDRFHSESIINTQPIVSIVAWWAVMVIFGWAVWPLLFALFPGLSDRGYGFAKAAGLLLVGWLAWFISSAQIPMWSQGGVLVTLLLFAALSLIIGWKQRRDLSIYINKNGRRLLWIEIITLLTFILFLIVRLTNPDLWHPYMGGEKPMDFAYFNGVLRSTVFPPIDPWHTGGYINYYYFGYVIVGSPVLLLGMMPSIAYNLIIPTLAALTGMGAFSVAFNVVNRWRTYVKVAPVVPAVKHVVTVTETAESEVVQPVITPALPTPPATITQRVRLGNPWIAGIVALMLSVVLGNLGTPRVFVEEGLLKAGGYRQPSIIQQQLLLDYRIRNGSDATGADLDAIIQQSNDEANSVLGSLMRGLSSGVNNAMQQIAPNRWYWAATRILQETPDGGGGAIAEFPFFTFLYGDLHAHMIAMPMLFMVMAFVLNEVLSAGNDRRRFWAIALALTFGGITVGMLRATNTWDWITFLLLGVLGIGFSWWISTERFTRRSVSSFVLRVAIFLIVSFIAVLPFTTWYASVYNRALISDLPRTETWRYLVVYGLFLFLLVSFLIWDTVRWLRSVYVRSLRGQLPLLIAGFLLVIGVLLVGIILASFGLPLLKTTSGLNIQPVPVAIITVPLILWIAVLFLRQGQSREMRYILALAGLSVVLTLAVEIVVLDGDVGRQNTVFKFYIQAWLMFSAVGGVAAACLVQSSDRWPAFGRWVWYPLGAILVAVAAMYPLMATRGRAQDRLSPSAPQTMADVPLTLDGMNYMTYSSLYDGDPLVLQDNPELAPFDLGGDYKIVRWLEENVQGTPTIMEGRASGEYHWESRISILTGFPSVNGWNFHQRQQRTIDPLPRVVEQRVANVNAFYSTDDISTAWQILRRYNVAYVIVGGLEHAYYPADSFVKFDDMVTQGLLEVVYQEGTNVIYKVKQDWQFALEESVAGGI
ncbi:MAG: DUF2298 domain-containing protein [Chloroflexi bacterium]|nr:DUF2298 domain-containing protein [Chloroflexota bacterium]MCC6896482.1 glycosyltransferase family 39 protein [Anaerolineae bacterium]